MKSSSPIRWLVLAAVLAMAAGGCGGGRSSAVPDSTTLTVAIADDVKSLDPAQAYDTWSTAVVHACTRRLVDYNEKAEIVPDVAEEWDESLDRRTYTFRLRADAKFSDGAPIEAEHFKAALDRVRDPKTASPGLSFYTDIDGVEAPDRHTLVVRLKKPQPTLLNVLGMTFAAPLAENGDPKKPGSGPYFVEAHESGSRVVLARSPFDARSPTRLQRIVLQLRVAEPLQLTRFNNGEVDLLAAIPPQEYARVMGDPQAKDNVVQGVVNQTWYFGMNVTRKPWSDPRVRRAAFMAINRDRHVQLAGAGQPANGILPPHVPGHAAERALPPQDLAGAKRMLAAAGYVGGVPESEKTVMWLANNAAYQRHAEAIQNDLKAVGIPVELRPVTLSQYLSGYKTQADCWYGGWYPDFPDAGNFLEPVLHGRSIPPNGANAAHYNSAQVNALLDNAATKPPGTARSTMYRLAEEAIMRDLPWVPLYFEMETRYFRDGVTGVTVHPVWRHMLTGIDKR